MANSAFQNFLNNQDAIIEAAKALKSAVTQSAKNAALQLMTQLCQEGVTLLSAADIAESGPAAMLVWQTQQTFSQQALNSCTGLSQAGLDSLSTNFAAAQLIQNSLIAALNLNSTQSVDIANLRTATSAGDFTGAVAAANQFVRDSNFVGLTVDSNGVSFQETGVFATLSPTWQPEQLTIQNTDGSSSNTVYNQNGGTTAYSTNFFDDAGTLVASLNANTDGTAFLTTPANTNLFALAFGAWSGASISGSIVSINLLDNLGNSIGTLSYDSAAGTATLVGSNGNPTAITFDNTNPVLVTHTADGGDTIAQLNGAAWHLGKDGALSSTINPFPDGLARTDGAFAALLNSRFNQAQLIGTDPIVLDLSGANGGTPTGVQLTSLANSNAFFDLHDTGFAVHTGWVSPTTGFLVSSTDPTNITDLFGNSSTDGFTALKVADTNHDGVINSSDTGFSSLYVWQDANGNGVADAGEVESLSQLGITSISLQASPVDETVNGNIISEVATFTYSNGNTGQVAEAFFNNSQLDSVFTGSFTLNPAVLLLPNLRGYGTMPDLYIAMSRDSTLLSMVQNLAGGSIADAATFDQQVTNIIYQWAGVSGTDPASRGINVNAQDLSALEAVTAEPYVTTLLSRNPNNAQGLALEVAYTGLFTAVKERLLAQGPLAQYLSGVSYNYDTDSLTGTADFSGLIAAIGDNVPSGSGPAAAQYLASLGQFVVQLASDLKIAASTFDTQLQSLFAAAGMPLSLGAIDNLHYLSPFYNGDHAGNIVFVNDSPGAIILGKTPNAILNGSGDLTQDIIAGIPTLKTANARLTVNEFNGFSTLIDANGSFSSATLTVVGGGTVDISNKTADRFDLFAGDNSGTTLIGNNANNEMLFASAGGTDTLQAGNGNNVQLDGGRNGTDTLIAGNGIGDVLIANSDHTTMIGGAGGDSFFIENNSASDTSTVIGHGTGNTIFATGDITGLTISGVQALNTLSVTLTSEELSQFSSLIDSNGSFSPAALTAAGGGVFDISHKTTDRFDLFAGSNNGTTLIGNNANNEMLFASASGTDTLQAGNGNNVQLDGGRNGTDTLIAGNGSGDVLIANSDHTTMIGGTGGDSFFIENNSASDVSTIIGHGTGNTMFATGDITGLTISGVQALNTLSVTLTSGELGQFSSLIDSNGSFSPAELMTAGGGVFDISHKTADRFDLFAGSNNGTTLIGNNANNEMLIASAHGNDTLKAGNGNNDVLVGGGSTDILQAGNGQGDVLQAGSGTTTLIAGRGIDTLIGGSGTDTFKLASSLFGAPVAGTTVRGGTGTNTLIANGDVSGVNITGVQNFQTLSATMTGAQFNGFSSLKAQFGTSGSITLTSGGTYSLIGKTTDAFNLTAQSNAGTTLIGNDASYESLTASNSGNDTLIGGNGDFLTLSAGYGTENDTLTAGNGHNDVLIANNGNDTLIAGNGGAQLQAGSGVDALIGGSGNDTFVTGSGLAAGSSIQGNGGADTLIGFGDISQAAITGVQTLQTTGIELTQAQLDAFTAVTGFGFGGQITAATAGTYSIAGKSTAAFDMIAGSNGGTTLIDNDANGESLTASATGNDTLIAGNGNNDILNAGGGNDTLNGGSGYDSYRFGSSFGQDVIHNAGGSAAKGEVNFTSPTITDENLWFQRSGNDLQVDLLGTNSQITVANWFGNAGAQVQSFNTADGLKLDSQVAQLVSAMASYAANSPGFNPATATQMPADATLQSTIAAAWHH